MTAITMRTPSPEAWAVALQHQRYAWCQAYRTARRIHREGYIPRHVINDLFSVAMLALAEAADRFDESLGWRFLTFACHVVRGALSDWLRDSNHGRRVGSREFYSRLVPINSSDAQPRLPSEPERWSDEEWELLLADLPIQQRQVLILIFRDDLPRPEVARRLRVSPETVTNYMCKALATLRRTPGLLARQWQELTGRSA